MQQRLPALREPPIKFAHRGAKAHAPENTLEAFDLALRLGATGLETDVWLSKDGVPLLDHGGYVKRGIRRLGLKETMAGDRPPEMPSLADLYEGCGTGYELSVDIKDPEAFDAVIETAREYDAEAHLWVCHNDWSFLADRRSKTTARLVNTTRVKDMKNGPERRAAELAEAGVDAVNLHHSDWSGGLTTLFHRFNRYCIAWDAQHVRLIKDLFRMGVDGVHSDHVDRLEEGFEAAH